MNLGLTNERDIHTSLDYQFRLGGCEKEAYVPVVAGGRNALTIHYTENMQAINPADLVLVDAGGQYQRYVTDITRTWPVSGKFSQPQRDLYEVLIFWFMPF